MPKKEEKEEQQKEEETSITLKDLAFSYRITPYVLVEKPLNAEKLTALLQDSDEEELVDNLDDMSDDDDDDYYNYY